MPEEGAVYVLDADSMIRAKRDHYAFDFCPGYWDGLAHAFEIGRVRSIDRVKNEIVPSSDGSRDDALAQWARQIAKRSFFEGTKTAGVQDAARKVLQHVENSAYDRSAKQKFSKGADPWLIAYCLAGGFRLVTYEVSEQSKAKVKIPDVAKNFGVQCLPPSRMLRELGIKLELGN